MQKMPEFNFLRMLGLFSHSNKCISNFDSFDEARIQCERLSGNKQYIQAISCAQKASIQYGLRGLNLYFPLEIQYLKAEQAEGEIIEIELVKALSILLKIEPLLSENESASFKRYKNELEQLTGEHQEDIKRESQALARYYTHRALH